MKFKKNEKYASIALYASISVIICAIIIMCIFRFDAVMQYIGRFFSAVSPLVYGFVFAYLFNPIMNMYEKKVLKFKKSKKDLHILRRTLSIILTLLTVFAVVAVILYAVIPQTVKSFEDLGSQLNNYITNIQRFADGIVTKHSEKFLGEHYETLAALLAEYDISLNIKDILSNSYTFLQSALNYAVDYGGMIVSQVINVLLGIIIAVYFLVYKEKICAQTKKLFSAMLSRRAYLNTVRLARYTHKTFGGFIVGKLIDSVIIGLISFVVFWAFKIPYYPLLAVIVGITNIIPTFGPIFGAIFGGLLLLIVAPDKVILFLIIVLIIQQVDGNIIGPKILGDKTGLSSLWVIVAILVGGSFFGVAGMFFGVPILACLTSLCSFILESRLLRKDLPTRGHAYQTDPPTREPGTEEEVPILDPGEKD